MNALFSLSMSKNLHPIQTSSDISSPSCGLFTANFLRYVMPGCCPVKLNFSLNWRKWCQLPNKVQTSPLLHLSCTYSVLVYRARRLLHPWLDPEGCRANVLEAEVLGRRSRDHPELADSSGFGGVHEDNLRSHHYFGFMDFHITVEKFFHTKVLQTLWFNKGGSAAHGAVTDGTIFVRAAGLTGAQIQLLSENHKQALGVPLKIISNHIQKTKVCFCTAAESFSFKTIRLQLLILYSSFSQCKFLIFCTHTTAS